MGYNLAIGQGTPLNPNSEEHKYRPTFEVKTIRLDNAPAFDEPTDHTNERWPSYFAWAAFTENAGLENLFRQLMPQHPGVAKITLAHKKMVDSAYEHKLKSLDKFDQNRLTWLKFWIDWALENCENPMFCNS